MNILEIEKNMDEGNNLFHLKVESDMFKEALHSYSNSKYLAAVSVALVLYEKMFATKLIRETSYPKEFVPSKNNLGDQVNHLMKREKKY